MHDLGLHNYWFIAGIFLFDLILFAYVSWAEENIEPSEFTFLGKIVNIILWSLSKVCNIGLGIAVGIEFFMLAHGA